MKQTVSFQEFTLSNGDCEVMVDIDTNTGKIIDLYCYADNVPMVENEETGKEYMIPTQPGKNPVFVHISRRVGFIFKLLLLKDFFVCLDETETDYEDSIKVFEKAMSKYKLPLDARPC